METAEAALKKFIGDEAASVKPTLQSTLEWFDTTQKHNYFFNYQLNTRLATREPLRVASGGFIALKAAGSSSQAETAASAAAAAVRLYLGLRGTGGAAPTPITTKFKGQELSGFQDPALFCTARIPREGRDDLVTFNGARHLTVVDGDRCYAVHAVSDQGVPMSRGALLECMQSIVADRAGTTPAPLPPGSVPGLEAVARCADRTESAKYRAASNKPEAGGVPFALIDTSIAHIVLDPLVPTNNDALAKALAVGSAAAPRYHDKSVEVRVFGNGTMGLSYESTGLDAHTATILANHLAAPTTDGAAGAAAPAPAALKPRATIQPVKGGGGAAAPRVATVVLRGEGKLGFGLNFARKNNFSADAFMRVVLQAAYFRVRHRMPHAEASVLMKGFDHGTNERVKAATAECAALVQATCQPGNRPGHFALKALLNAAIESQVRLTEACRGGDGCVNHWLALEQVAAYRQRTDEDPYTVPDFFTSDAFVEFKNGVDVVSSNVSCPTVAWHGVTPAQAKGYGVGYVIDQDCVRVTVTSGLDGSDADAYASWIYNVFSDLEVIFE